MILLGTGDWKRTGPGKRTLTPLALVPPVFGNLFGGLVQPIHVSGQTDHLDCGKPFWRVGSRIAQGRQFAFGHQNLESCGGWSWTKQAFTLPDGLIEN